MAAVAVSAAIAGTESTIRPEDYGAIGDGQHDDSAALQDAIDAAAGKTLQLNGDRTYLVSVGLVVDAPTTVKGGKILAAVNEESRSSNRGSNSLLRFTRNAAGSELREIEIDLGGNGRTAVRIQATDMHIEDLTVRNYRKFVKADNVLHSKSESGLRISASNVSVSNVHCEDMQTTVPDAVPRCVTIHGHANNVLLQNISGRNINGGITIGSSTDVRIDGFDFRNLSDNGLYILPGSNQLTAKNGYIENINESIVFKGRNSTVSGLRIHNQEQAIGLENAIGVLLTDLHVSFDGDLATRPSFIRTRRGNKRSEHIVIRGVEAEIPFGNAVLNLANGTVDDISLSNSTFRLQVDEARTREGRLYLIRQNGGSAAQIVNSTFILIGAGAAAVEALFVKAPDFSASDAVKLQAKNVLVHDIRKLPVRVRNSKYQ